MELAEICWRLVQQALVLLFFGSVWAPLLIPPFVHNRALCVACSAQVLCGFKLFAWRQGHQRRGAMRALRGPRGSIPSESDVAQREFHATFEPSSKREALDSGGKFFVGSTPQAIMRRGATGPARVPRAAGPTRVPRRSILHCAGPTHRLGF